MSNIKHFLRLDLSTGFSINQDNDLQGLLAEDLKTYKKVTDDGKTKYIQRFVRNVLNDEVIENTHIYYQDLHKDENAHLIGTIENTDEYKYACYIICNDGTIKAFKFSNSELKFEKLVNIKEHLFLKMISDNATGVLSDVIKGHLEGAKKAKDMGRYKLEKLMISDGYFLKLGLGSCMETLGNRFKCFNNLGKFYMLRDTLRDKVIARCIVWNAGVIEGGSLENKQYADRLYFNDGDARNIFINHLKAEDIELLWGDLNEYLQYPTGSLYIDINEFKWVDSDGEKWDLRECLEENSCCPWIDTFSNYSTDTGLLYCYDWRELGYGDGGQYPEGIKYAFLNTQGRVHVVLDGVYVPSRDEYYDEDDCVYSERTGDYIFSEDAVWSDYHNSYLFEDDAVYCDVDGDHVECGLECEIVDGNGEYALPDSKHIVYSDEMGGYILRDSAIYSSYYDDYVSESYLDEGNVLTECINNEWVRPFDIFTSDYDGGVYFDTVKTAYVATSEDVETLQEWTLEEAEAHAIWDDELAGYRTYLREGEVA